MSLPARTSRMLLYITADSGAPYVGSLAKVATAILDLLEAKGKNKKTTKELCDSIANTIVVVDTLIKMQRDTGEIHFKDVCLEMERYLDCISQELKDAQRKQRGIMGVFDAPEFKATIKTYGKRVHDLKVDFLLQVMGDCKLALNDISCQLQDLIAETQSMKDTASKEVRVIRTVIRQTAYYSALALCLFAFFVLFLTDDDNP
ncbi:hypothetical protein IW261DRAFT_1521088 [Armillaria novae-zelandiae]|uniref:Uncharacterized protein n=1 Tax=Armillaria novae-zelandiae TaxID=153914 RepID=A0AA39NJE3_9AGAR|nr:hypothetical protein IW261DRAFT_1521088 [Armillaria novae-zelandiae]